MDKQNKNLRFTEGKLVMYSKKNTRSGLIKYFLPTTNKNKSIYSYLQRVTGTAHRYVETYVDNMKRGVPFLLIEDPKLVSTKEKYFLYQGTNSDANSRAKGQMFWRIKFLYKEQIYVSYLTRKQYSQELVIAVLARLNKDYSIGGKNKTIF